MNRLVDLLRLLTTRLKSFLRSDISASSSGVMTTWIPERYFIVSLRLMYRRAVMLASRETIVYRLVAFTSKGQSGR